MSGHPLRESWGGLGLTQLQFNNVSRTHQLLLPQGRAVCGQVLMITSIQWCASVVHVTPSSASCCQKEAARRTPQLSLSYLEHTKEETKKRWGNEHKIRLELWTDDALVESRWVVWSSKITAPSHKQKILFYLCFWSICYDGHYTVSVSVFYLKESHLHKTKSDTNNSDSLNKTLITSWMICRNPVVETGRCVQNGGEAAIPRGHLQCGSGKPWSDTTSQWP